MKTQPLTTRRRFLAVSAAATVVSAANPARAQGDSATGPFKLPDLPYTVNALEPHIDAMTMGIHHGKHHQGYVNNLNKAVAAHAGLEKKTLDELVGGIPFLPESAQSAVRNNGGGHWNHSFFWESMAKPDGDGAAGPKDDALKDAIHKAFGSLDAFKKEFADAAAKRFGSGWAWLIVKDGGLAVVSTPNQDNPLMQGIVPNADRGIPILGIDVWEHAYYLKYQNLRGDYVSAWWNVVNWKNVAARFGAAASGK